MPVADENTFMLKHTFRNVNHLKESKKSCKRFGEHHGFIWELEMHWDYTVNWFTLKCERFDAPKPDEPVQKAYLRSTIVDLDMFSTVREVTMELPMTTDTVEAVVDRLDWAVLKPFLRDNNNELSIELHVAIEDVVKKDKKKLN